MNFPGQGLFEDPVGILLGTWRRLRGGADGEPTNRFDNDGRLLTQTAKDLQYLPTKLADLIRDNPQRPEALGVLAQLQLDAMEWEAALATGTILRTRFPPILDGYRVVGVALRGLGRYAESEAMFRAAMRRFPTNVRIAAQYAHCAQATGDFDEALRRCSSAIRRFPDDRWLHFLYVRLATAAKRPDDAARMSAHNIRHWPDQWESWLLHLQLAEASADWQTAVAVGHEMLARFPNHSQSYWRAAKALRMVGDTAAAAALINTGSFIFPRDPDVLRERDAVIAAGGIMTPHSLLSGKHNDTDVFRH